MKIKALLLGTGAAVAFAGAQAQAADLSIAEPVDYVRVCDAFGTGYWYIPGTDTCLRIGGFVRFEARIGDSDFGYGADFHDRDWEFFTRANLQVEARSMTDWGPLVSYIEFEADFVDGASDDVGAASPTVEEAWLSLGPITAGYAQSNFDWGGGYTYEGLDGFGAITDTKTNQIALSWAMNGFGLILAVEDGENRAESWFGFSSYAGDVPDLVAAITAEGQGWNAKLAFIYAPGGDLPWQDDSWGVQGGVEFDVFGSDKLMLAAGYLDSDIFNEDVWSLLGSYKHFWQSNLYSAITANYTDWDGDDEWGVAFNTVYSPVENFSVGAEITYYDGDLYDDGDWGARIRLQRDFGG